MIEQPLDLRRIRLILRRHRTLLVAATLAGVAVGIGVAALRPPLPTSTALVLLPPPPVSPNGVTLRDIDTQVRIADGDAILAVAAGGMTPPATAAAVKPDVQVTAPTTDLISVRAKARTAANAEALAGGVANGYIGYVNNQSTLATKALQTSLVKQKAQLDQRIAGIEARINTVQQRLDGEALSSTNGATDRQLLNALKAEAGNASLQRSSITTQIKEAGAAPGQGAAGSRLFQPASRATRESLTQQRLTYGVLAGLAALMLCAAIVVVVSRRGRRPRLRDEIAEAVGAPILASVGARWPKDTSTPEALAHFFEPDVMNTWSIRRALEDIGSLDPSRTDESCLSFIALEDDQDALAVGPQFALMLASQGVPTRLETSLDDDWVVQLRAMLTFARSAEDGARDAGRSARGTIGTPAPVRVAIATVDRQAPKLAHPAEPTVTVLALSPGAASVAELARIALAAIDAGQRLDGVIVANAEPGDGTIGRLSQRSGGTGPPLPNRLMGTTEESWR